MCNHTEKDVAIFVVKILLMKRIQLVIPSVSYSTLISISKVCKMCNKRVILLKTRVQSQLLKFLSGINFKVVLKNRNMLIFLCSIW